MSGLAGIVFTDGREVTQPMLQAMASEGAETAVEEIGIWRGGPAGFVCFHMATTPEGIGERQPWRDSASGKVIVFDGRLDNRDELLQSVPKLAPSTSDCELAFRLWERLGEDFVSRLAGDYALAIWDERARRLFCVRSPMGWRPFLYAFDGRRFGFATQPRVLINGLQIPKRLNEGAIGEYLSCRFTTQEETFWAGVQRLPGGHALVVENQTLRVWRWHKGPFEDYSRRSEAEHVSEFNRLFDQALISTTRSSSPVVAQLSGGLDSSSVVCRATELQRSGRIRQALQAESMRDPGEIHDETEWSSAVEQHLGIQAVVTRSIPYSLDEAQEWCKKTLHLPLRPNVLMPSLRRLQGEGVRVLLTGEGGDDWLSGRNEHWPDLARTFHWGQLAREALLKDSSLSWLRRAKNLGTGAFGPLLFKTRREQALRPHLAFGYTAPPWIKPDWARRIDLKDRWRQDCAFADLDSHFQNVRFQAYGMARRYVNWENALAHADMHGVELRHPLHDLRLTRFLMGVNGRLLRCGQVPKYLLRQAMRGTLPEKVRTRRGKANFTTLIADTISARFREKKTEEWLPVKLGWVDGTLLKQSHADYVAHCRERSFPQFPKIHYGAVWFAMSMDLWLEHAFRL